MDPEEHTQDDQFETLGWYSPRDAERLLNALDDAQIAHRAKATGGTGAIFVQTDHGLVISVEVAERDKAHELHVKLFGDALPNFESAFFRDDPRKTTSSDDKEV
jgi:hypothetical protein